MTASIDLSHAERVSLTEALGGAHRAARVKLMSSSGPIPPRPMLWPCAGDMLNALHDLAPVVAPDIDLLVVHRAVAGGWGGHLKLDGVLVYADGPYPSYIKHWYDHDITPESWSFDAPVRLSLPKAFVITHFNYVWGHWLTEMYPKLFLIRALIKAGVVAPLLLPASAPAYMKRIARALIPDLEIVTYNSAHEAVEVGTALLPHMLHKDYYFHDVLRWELEREALKHPRGGGFDKVFVSRGGVRTPQTFREMTNEAEIEAIAQDLGLTLLRPETLPWEEQARIFSRARVVAGEFGSGLHNALLSPEGCQVVSLNWLVEVQSRIGHFRRHDVGYILPDDGRARLYTIEPQIQPFTIDAEDFRRKLGLAVERAEARAAMAGWDDGPIIAPDLLL
ncbi:glycosyltransferase family 61 protein [Caulobacter sp.]|uniref:glycosyltransferase family 61 protein n=1 Tax=Caulobacter sp. TaxID=78 RepID=UPI002B470628|nr:glycosyltransferase 61 family protein [Caulobacter sp.]HJV40033.1 glycosyltransferase 61 family protein [Caulobacter sp.]